MNKQIKWVGIMLVMCYLAVFARLHQTQLFATQDIAEKPTNLRQTDRKLNLPRGMIISADGFILARSEDVGGNMTPRKRIYPEGDLFGHITGIQSRLFQNILGVERTYDQALTGVTLRQQFDGLANLFAKRENVGNVGLTVRKDLQQLAKDQLRDREGAVTVMDPRTGAILAMWSNPSYDPNTLVPDGSKAQIDAANEAWALYNQNPADPLLAKTYRQIFNPGSSYKPVTAAAALTTNAANLAQPIYPQLKEIKFFDSERPIANFDSQTCGGALQQVFTTSCNTAFAQMGVDTKMESLAATSKGFGWLQDVPIDLPSPAKSTLPETTREVGQAGTGQTAIGQQHNFATPLQVALVAAGIANGGVVMKPHVMAEIRNQDATVVETYKPEPWLTAVSPDVAATTRQLMLGPVNDPNGTAKGQINMPSGMIAGGKTGTAQTGTGLLHTWFMGYAGPVGQPPKVVVSVVVLRQRVANDVTGGRISAPIANAMLNKALEVVDEGQVDPTSAIVSTTSSVPPAGPFGPGVGGPSTATVPTTIRRQG